MVMKLKCKNHRVTTPTSLCHVVAAVGSSRVLVQGVGGEIVSRPGAVM
jgi:hypothetical protein